MAGITLAHMRSVAGPYGECGAFAGEGALRSAAKLSTPEGKVMKLTRYLIPAFVAAPAAFGLFTAPPAIAECNSSGYATVCAQGDVRGGSAAPVTGPVDPYPCDDDWMCSDGVDINWGPIWRPGRPGGPGGPGGIGPR